MAKKNICLIPADWDLDTYSRHNCKDQSHPHLSHAEVYRHEQKNVVTWLRRSGSKRESSVVQIFILPEVIKPNVTARQCATSQMNTGLSNRVGPYLARKVRVRENWAIVMLSQINRRGEDPFYRSIDEIARSAENPHLRGKS